MKKWYVFINLLIILTSTTSCLFIESAPAPVPAPEPAPTSVIKLSIISQEMTREDGIPQVQATIKNVGPAEIGLVEATVDFLDGNGNLIDSSITTATNLEPQQTWDFVVICSGESCKRVISCKIRAKGTTTEQRRIDLGRK